MNQVFLLPATVLGVKPATSTINFNQLFVSAGVWLAIAYLVWSRA